MNRATRIAAASCAILLAGCQVGQPTLSTSNIPPRQAVLLEGRIIVPAPQGYCVDQDSLQDHKQSGFVLIAGCDGLMGLPSGTMIEPAILTVAARSLDQPVDEPLDVAAALDKADVLERRKHGGLTLLHLQSPEAVPDDSAPEHWRGAMVVNGAIVSVAIYGNGSIADEAGAELLQVLARQIQEASGPELTSTPPSTPKKTKNLFQRIFN
jgi:hypothetical protein